MKKYVSCFLFFFSVTAVCLVFIINNQIPLFCHQTVNAVCHGRRNGFLI